MDGSPELRRHRTEFFMDLFVTLLLLFATYLNAIHDEDLGVALTSVGAAVWAWSAGVHLTFWRVHAFREES